MKKINRGFMFVSGAFTLTPGQVRRYEFRSKPPEVGDVIYGRVSRIGQHSSLENKSGRIHAIQDGTKAIFVFGNRYAPDYFEALVPEQISEEVDLVARSGIVGQVKAKNSAMKDPTRVRVLGYVCDEQGTIVNTRTFRLIKPRKSVKRYPRARMVLVCGTSMNAGKSLAAAACCWALSSAGYKVRAAKVTGTASLKDILQMNDAGATHYADFTYLGYPSTYLLDEPELLDIFDTLDLKFANNRKNFWVVELADGVIQRETAMLLTNTKVRSRIDKLIFCASDAFGAIGGLRILAERFNLLPDAISGVCSSSPLLLRELLQFTNIPVFNSAGPDNKQLVELLTSPCKQPALTPGGV